MAETVAEIAIRVGADITPLTKGLKKGDEKVNKFAQSARKTTSTVAKLGFASVAAGAAIGVKLVADSLAAVDAQAKLAKQLNTTSTSMAVLNRAGELGGVSMATIGTAARTLSVRIGEAEQGLKSSADAFKTLKLDASALAELPLDERISKINIALKENVPAAERAATAADLFGTRAATAIKLLDTDVIAQARRETELFGLAISDVDAAQVEAANDSFSRIGKGVEGLGQQLAVGFAPIVKGVGDEFASVVEEMGGMEKVAESVFNNVIKGVGFVLDAVNGLKVVAAAVVVAFQSLGTAIIAGFGLIIQGWTEVANLVPGIDIDYKSTFFGQLEKQTIEGFKRSKQAFTDLVKQPPPSEELKAWIAEITEITQEQAEIAAESRNTELQNVVQHQESMTDAEKKEAEKRKRIAEQEQKRRVSAISTMFSDLSSLTQTENKKQFEIGKKAAVAGAIVDSIGGAQKAFTALAGIPIVGPALGAAAAAAALAAGNVRIQQIKSQSFAGGGSAGGGGGGVGSAAAGATGGEAVQGEGAQERNTFVNLDPAKQFTGQAIIDLINGAVEDGANLRIDPGVAA
jgi:hypothetical protein